MNKISVISGGSSGLGLEIAELLIKSGKNVLILGRNKENLAMASARLLKASNSGKAESLVCNIGDQIAVNQAGTFIKDCGYEVDFLFNNAGLGLFIDAKSSSSVLIDRIFEANIKGMILLTTEILKITPEDADLTVVNIMSTSAILGRANETIYCAAKWAARGYTEALRTEFKGTNRNFIAVYPGGMKTEFWNKVDTERNLSGFMDPAEVALKIVNAVTGDARLLVTDITINRK